MSNAYSMLINRLTQIWDNNFEILQIDFITI